MDGRHPRRGYVVLGEISKWLCCALPLLLFPVPAQACGIARGPAQTAEDYIDAEQAVIIWDEAHKTEHFIRQVDIQAQEPDLGFLVPTPQAPELVEADPRIFQLAADVGHPQMVQEVVYHKPLDVFLPVLKGPLGLLFSPFTKLITGLSAGSEEQKIITEQNVAGYHAITLAAADAPSLARWLKENNYSWTPQLAAWLEPYVKAKWSITVFKLMKVGNQSVTKGKTPIVSRAIRMSFVTERPFFPYSEPGDKERAHEASPFGRTLRVAILSSARMVGMLGEGHSWRGDLQFAGASTPPPGSAGNAGNWLAFARLTGQMDLPTVLTYWRDDSNPRPGTSDLYFYPARDQSLFRETMIDYSIPPRHLFDFSDVFSDLSALTILGILPVAPLYCGWRLGWGSRPPMISNCANLSRRSTFIVGRILGAACGLMGMFYFIGCLTMAYFLSRAFAWLPGEVLPPLCQPPAAVFIGCLFLTLIYSGGSAFREEAATVKVRPATGLRGFWDYFAAGCSMLIGVGFCFGTLLAIWTKFSD